MYDGNPGEIGFGSSQREGSSYRESTVAHSPCDQQQPQPQQTPANTKMVNEKGEGKKMSKGENRKLNKLERN